MRSPQDHAGRLARLERFLPACRAQAPTVARSQAGKAELWRRRRKIIAAGLGKLEELSSHDGADGMTTDVFSTRIAASVSEEPRQGLHRAVFESVAQDIPGRSWPAPSVPAVIPQHRRPRTAATPQPPAADGGRRRLSRPGRSPARQPRPSSAGHLERLRQLITPIDRSAAWLPEA